MDGLIALAQARASGLDVRADGDRLRVRGPRAAESLARALLACKPEVMALLASDHHEIAWRVAIMRPQVPARGPIPFLVARQGSLAADAPGRCMSCGDVLDQGRRVRCAPCVQAIQSVLDEVREGVGAT